MGEDSSKIFFDRKVFLSALLWAGIGFVLLLISSLLIYLLVTNSLVPEITSNEDGSITVSSTGVGNILFKFFIYLADHIVLFLIFYIPVKRNEERLNLKDYKYKSNYMLYIYLLLIFLEIMVSFVASGSLSWPQSLGILPVIIILFITFLFKEKA